MVRTLVTIAGLLPCSSAVTAAWAALATVSLPGIATPQPAVPGIALSTRDSAGVTIIDHGLSRRTVAAPFLLSNKPELTIGSADGGPPYLFVSIGGARRLGDGRIAVFDDGAFELRVFGPTGRFLYSTGGPGVGPGEFEHFAMLSRSDAETLWVGDSRLSRVTVVTPNGRVVRTISLQERRAGTRPLPVGRFADGTYLVTVATPQAISPGRRPEWVTYALVAPDGKMLDSLVTRFDADAYLAMSQVGDQRGLSRGTVPFTASAAVAVGRNGFYYTDARTYRIDYYTKYGALQRVIRLQRRPARVTPAQITRYASEWLARTPPDRRPMIERRIRDMPFAETAATFDRLLVDARERLWAREWGMSQPGRRWWVFSPTGSALGVMDVPDGCQVLDVGADYLVCGNKDRDDVPRVDVYSLRPGGAGA